MDTNTLIIHVRFFPDGTVMEVGERPKGINPQEWFNHLSRNTQNGYASLSGGCGVFRLTREQVDALKESCQSGAAA